jgi:hypothetical protein
MKERDHVKAREHALALREWVGRGGFYPPNYSRVEVDAYLKNVLRRTDYLDREVR